MRQLVEERAPASVSKPAAQLVEEAEERGRLETSNPRTLVSSAALRRPRNEAVSKGRALVPRVLLNQQHRSAG
jgi:hypothetical protein